MALPRREVGLLRGAGLRSTAPSAGQSGSAGALLPAEACSRSRAGGRRVQHGLGRVPLVANNPDGQRRFIPRVGANGREDSPWARSSRLRHVGRPGGPRRRRPFRMSARSTASPAIRSAAPSPGRFGRRTEPLWRDVAGAVLREERQRQHRTLAQIAERAGMSVQYLSELERGRKEASSEMLAAACGSLGLSLGEFARRCAGARLRVSPADRPGAARGLTPTGSGIADRLRRVPSERESSPS